MGKKKRNRGRPALVLEPNCKRGVFAMSGGRRIVVELPLRLSTQERYDVATQLATVAQSLIAESDAEKRKATQAERDELAAELEEACAEWWNAAVREDAAPCVGPGPNWPTTPEGDAQAAAVIEGVLRAEASPPPLLFAKGDRCQITGGLWPELIGQIGEVAGVQGRSVVVELRHGEALAAITLDMRHLGLAVSP